jgi:hypothetical protein
LVDGFPTGDRADGTLRGIEEGAPLPRAGRRSSEAGSAESQGRGETPDREESTMANNTQQILRILNNSNLRLFEKLDLIDGMGTGQNKN